MRLLKYISAIYLFVFCTLNVKAQTVTIADNAFKQCLVDSMPSTLDASQNLILSQAAGIIKLECPNYGIVTIDELKYFTGLQKLNLSKNPIISLPDISALSSMTDFNIGETSITTLPNFADFPNLKYLFIYRMYLTQFPDLSQNTNLIRVSAHTNYFDTILPLNLPNLERLEISLTRIKYLPDLTKLKKLRQLECFRNSITQLPDLSGLDSLKVLDASTNSISQISALPKGLNTLYLDNNAFTTTPNLSPLTALTKVRLFKNYLTFEDLLSLTSLPGYPSIFEISPQKNIPVGYNQTVLEPASLSIDSKVDITLPEVTRNWYFNNVLTGQTDRYYTISQTKASDQGNYYCTLSHPSFPGLVLQTDNFNATIVPCVNLSGVSLDITGSTCLKQGALKINLSNQPGSNYTFELEGLQSHKKQSNTSGQFANLEDLDYTLTIDAQNGCKYTQPNNIVIPRENCTQIVITPNGDNVDDSYYFSQSGNAKVVDKWGNVVTQLSLPTLWDAYSNGRRVPVGYYLVNINNGEEILKLSVIY